VVGPSASARWNLGLSRSLARAGHQAGTVEDLRRFEEYVEERGAETVSGEDVSGLKIVVQVGRSAFTAE
jgi:hypothetical protein